MSLGLVNCRRAKPHGVVWEPHVTHENFTNRSAAVSHGCSRVFNRWVCRECTRHFPFTSHFPPDKFPVKITFSTNFPPLFPSLSVDTRAILGLASKEKTNEQRGARMRRTVTRRVTNTHVRSSTCSKVTSNRRRENVNRDKGPRRRRTLYDRDVYAATAIRTR